MKKELVFALSCLVLLAAFAPKAGFGAISLAQRLQGHVLLQVQQHGEAWYVNPDDGKRYYMKDGPAAYQLMRFYSLGISNTNLSLLQAGNASLHQKLVGRILLQVEAHGEAYYVCPLTHEIIYVKDGVVAYQVMRQCSLGITDADLAQIPLGELSSTPPGQTPSPTPTPSPAPTPSPTPTPATVATIAGCQVFPADNAWNQDISALPLHPQSATFIAAIGASGHLHPDFGENQEYGIPFNVVPANQALVPIEFTAYGDESDEGPYPLPATAKRESGSDHHVLVLQQGSCRLYELFNAYKVQYGLGWTADSAAIFDLNSNALRPEGWTSADAAGLPILPGLIRYDEVAAGKVMHAIRFTASRSQRGYIHPATHFAGSNDASLPPMGLRVRMKASYDTSGLSGQAAVIAQAMKTYGMILADNGSSWYFTGATDPGWNDDELNAMKSIPGSAFEAVYTGPILP